MAKSLDDAWEHYSKSKDVSHRTPHIQAVLGNALLLSEHHPKLDKNSVAYAAILHDIAHEEQFLGNTDNHAATGAQMAKEYVQHLPKKQQRDIINAIETHMKPAGSKKSELGKLISDADRLASGTDNLARRMYLYRREDGMGKEEAMRKAYWYMRHRKLNKKLGVKHNLEFEESKSMAVDNLRKLRELTTTFEDFQKLVGVGDVVPYKVTEKSREAYKDLPVNKNASCSAIESLIQKVAWVEAIAPTLMASPATKAVAERTTRKVIRSATRPTLHDAVKVPDSNTDDKNKDTKEVAIDYVPKEL